MLAKRLHKKGVTYFSPSLYRLEPETEVVIGGEVKSVFDMADCLDMDSLKSKDQGNVPVYVVLDDSVGTIQLVLIRGVYDLHEKHIKPGNVIIAKGLVEKVKNEAKVFAYDISPLVMGKSNKGE